MADLPSGTLTFLFTDIEGSTRLLRQLRDRYSAVLADHRRILRAAFQRYGGEEIGTEGDSFFVVFRRARDAVAAAAEGQRALAAYEWPDDAPIRVRMGMNTGEPSIDEDGSYVGLGVHLAARIASAGHGGQVLLSQATCALLHADEAQLDVDVSDLGEHWLKDFERPERIFQLVGDGLPSTFPALKTLDKQAVDATAREGRLPYKGLEAFQPQDAEFFFGREELVGSLAERLAGSRFLAVIGPSGSGKSSVVRAGLIPAIWRGAVPAGREWKVVLLTPGPEPLEELAVRLAAEGGLPAGSLLADLRADAGNVCLATRQLMLDRSADANVALVVDQFEEVFTLCRRDDDRRTFIEALVRVAESDSSRGAVVLSLRADFYGHCASYPELVSLLEQNQAIVGPMRESELRRAIERPAAAAGVDIEPELPDAILDDLGDEPGNLPLLSHALLETWKRRDGGRLTVAGYRDAGGVREAIARTADSVYTALTPERQELARRIFLRLAEPGHGTEDTRRRAELDELLPRDDGAEAVEAVLETLASERLITIGQGTVEVAHEALIREWPQFRRWLDEDREGLQIHRRLTEEANEWNRLERSADVLYRGARLHAARAWAEGREAELSALEREFLDACGEAAQTELDAARRRNRRLRALAGGLAVLLVVALAAAVVAVRQSRRAEEQSRLATSRGLVQASAAQLGEGVDLALLLGLEAHRAKPSVDTRNALLRAVQRGGRIIQHLNARGSARDVAFSADGRMVASVGEGGLVLWDARTRRALPAPSTRTNPRDVVAFTPDGRTLATDDGRGGLAIWDVRTRRVERTVSGVLVNDLAFAPDGETLAVGSEEGVLLFDRSGRRLGRPLARGDDPALRLAYSPDGSAIAASSLDGTIALWNLKRRAPIERPLQASGLVEAIAFSADARTLVAAANDVFVWRLDGRTVVRRQLDVEPTTVALGPTGVLAVAERDNTISLWDLDAGRELARGRGAHHKSVTALAFGPSGRTLASSGEDGKVVLWNAAREVGGVRLRRSGDAVPAVAFRADGNRVAAAVGPDVLVWTLRGRPVSRIETGSSPILDLDISESGTIAAGTADGRVATTNIASPTRTQSRAAGDAPVTAVAFARDGSLAAAADRVRVWNPTGGAGQPLEDSGGVQDVAFSPSGVLIAAGGANGVTLYEATSRRRRDGSLGTNELVRQIAFSPDGDLLATAGGEDVDIEVWDVERNVRDGAAFVSPTDVGSVAFSPDSRIVAAGTSVGTIVIWDAVSRSLLGEPIAGHTGAVLDVAFDTDGRTLASAGSDGAVIVHDVAPWLDDDALAERACAIVGRNFTRVEWETFLPDEPYRTTCAQWPATT
jgi:WD40 repeat protein/class 3 adenylate cyclase